MTSSYPESVHGLKMKLDLTRALGFNSEVNVEQLPYSCLREYRFQGDHSDVIILCHSVENRRFAITDVHDSLYDEFLQNCMEIVGKSRIVKFSNNWPGKNLVIVSVYSYE